MHSTRPGKTNVYSSMSDPAPVSSQADSNQTPTTNVTGAHRKLAGKTSMGGTRKRTQDVTYIEIGDPTSKKPSTQDGQETGSRDTTTKKHLWHHSPKSPQTSGQLSTQVHHSDEIGRKPRKTVQDWSSDSASEAKYAPLDFERNPSSLYYNGADHNDPDLSIYAQDESFDDDGDSAFTPKQVSLMKATMRDILKEFQCSCLQKTDLNQTLEDLSERLFRKSRSTTKSFPPTRTRSLGRLRYGSPESIHSSHSDDRSTRHSRFIFQDQTHSRQDSDESIEDGPLIQP